MADRAVKVFMYFLLLMSLLSCDSAQSTYTLEITEQELQEKIQHKMPIQKKKFFVTVTLSDPKVALLLGKDRIDVESNIDALLPGGVTAKGRGNIEGRVEYLPQSGEFYFVDPQVISLAVDNVAAKHQETIRKVADFAAKSALKRLPVYRFKDNNLKQKLAKAVLKSVHVENGRLLLELGL